MLRYCRHNQMKHRQPAAYIVDHTAMGYLGRDGLFGLAVNQCPLPHG
jgi:hypothetical protein